MSLLNDALRQAEQRQNKPQVSAAYTGQTAQATGGSRAVPVLIVLLVLALLAAGVAWWLLAKNSAEPTVETTETVAQIEPVQPQPIKPAEPEPVAAPEPAATIAEPVTVAAPKPEPAVKVAEAPKQPEPVAAAPAPKKEPQPEVRPEPQQEVEVAAEEPAPVAQVKQSRETPQAIDLRTSRELQGLLASGDNVAAENLLTRVTESQPAPNSREIFAREMLVQGMAGRALEWLPQSLAGEHAGLRLLRARALLEQGNLDTAVATLQSRVPPVADGIEYRVTLATLLQQAGEAEESAGHWSELIAYDDSRGAWWLGLAIALETGGRTRSAVQAYAQAATLPGLSPSLADYARQRLNALQAGS